MFYSLCPKVPLTVLLCKYFRLNVKRYYCSSFHMQHALLICFQSREVFSSCFYFIKKQQRTFSLCLHRVMVTLVKVWKNSKLLWKHSPAARVSTVFLVLPNFTLQIHGKRFVFGIQLLHVSTCLYEHRNGQSDQFLMKLWCCVDGQVKHLIVT